MKQTIHPNIVRYLALEDTIFASTEYDVLDLGTRSVGSTGYMEDLSPNLLTSPVMVGYCLERPFLAFRCQDEVDGTMRIAVIFQRYQNNDCLFVCNGICDPIGHVVSKANGVQDIFQSLIYKSKAVVSYSPYARPNPDIGNIHHYYVVA